MITRRGLLQIAGALAIPVHDTTPDRTLNTAGLQAALDDIATTAAVGVLAEVHDNTRVWRGAAGVSRLGTQEPVPVAGRFRAGSITKSFVATVVLQLVGEGRLGLDDTLEQRLPGILPSGDRITMRQLLQHTSGVANYTNAQSFRAVYRTPADIVRLRDHTWTPGELVAFVDDLPLLFEPGTGWMYSNTNFVLLSMVVERLTGVDYAAEVRRRILRPLGLRNTRLPGTDPALRGPHPHGYLPADDGPVDITEFNPSVAGASGELTSTAAELNAFFRALIGGRLLGRSEQEQMQTARATPHDYQYGLGLMTRQVSGGTRLWGHRGDIFGYYAESWTSENGRRQVTVAVTPWGDVDPKVPITDLVETVFER